MQKRREEKSKGKKFSFRCTCGDFFSSTFINDPPLRTKATKRSPELFVNPNAQLTPFFVCLPRTISSCPLTDELRRKSSPKPDRLNRHRRENRKRLKIVPRVKFFSLLIEKRPVEFKARKFSLRFRKEIKYFQRQS